MVGDIAVKNGFIAAIDKTINQSSALEYSVDSLLVCPGLIDFHTHICWGGGWGVDADKIGPKSCVTTLVDFGTCGAANISGFIEHIVKKSQLNLYSFLNIAFNGLSGAVYAPDVSVYVGELEDLRMAIPDRAIQAGTQYHSIIRGIKIRCCSDAAGTNGVVALRTAKKVSLSLKKPLAVHIGTPPATVEEILPVLEKGDILTHAFRGDPNSLIDGQGNVVTEAIEARKRGVLFDIGHGSGSFSFDTAEKLIKKGFYPDVISSDLHVFSIDGPAYDLPATMSKFLGLGLSVSEIIERVTLRPAQAINITEKAGTLAVGRPADIAVLEIERGNFNYSDTCEKTLCFDQRFSPKMTIKDGELIWGKSLRNR